MNKHTSIDLNAIELFYRITNAGSIGEASRRLRVPKSTLSRRLVALERSLGAKLFNRKGRNVNLTEAGRLLYTHCERILGDVDLAVASLSELDTQIRSTLRISLPPDIGVNWLASTITAFTAENPGIDVYADVTNRWVDLLEEPYDLSIHVGGGTQDDPRPTRLIAQLGRAYFLSKRYSERKGIPKTTSELHVHDCIIHEAQRREGLWLIKPQDREETKQVKARVTVNNTSTVRELALAGAGVAILTESTALSSYKSGLIRILDDWPISPLSVYATYLQKRDVPQKIKSFLNILKTQVNCSSSLKLGAAGAGLPNLAGTRHRSSTLPDSIKNRPPTIK